MTRTTLDATTRRRPMAAALMAASALAMAPLAAAAQEINVWSGYPEMVPFYEHVAEQLKAEFPDATINVQAISLREHERRVALGLSSGSAGTLVVEMASSTARRYIENDLLPPAPEDIAAFVTDPANFLPFFQDAVSMDGTVYGMPLFRGQVALFYNLDKFAAAGLDGPPTTMAEYTEYATKLTERDANGNPTVSGWSLRLSGGGQGIAEKFWINLHQFGGVLLEEVEPGRWRAGYATEAGRNTLAQYLENVWTHGNVTIEMPADTDAFQRELTAMFIRESPVIADTATKAPDLNYATAPLPRGSISLPTNLFVNEVEGDAADLAWAYVRATNEPENLVWLLDRAGWLPNRSGVDYSSVTDKVPAYGAFVDFPEGYEFFTLPAIGPIEEVLTRLAARLTAAYGDASLAGDMDAIDAALAAAAEETNTILRREGLLAE